MNSLYQAIFFGLLASTVTARPQYGPSQQVNVPDQARQPAKQLPPGCKFVHKTVYDIVQKEEFETKCVPKLRNVCEEQLQKICEPHQEQVCDYVNEQKCDTLYRDKCYEAYKDVPEEYQEEECADKVVKVCEKHWEVISETEKIWTDDPVTCKDLKETECHQVTKHRTKKEPYQKCDKEPYQNCYNVPRQVCNYVTKERCRNEPQKLCKDVPYEDCQEVHKLVPHQVARLKMFKVCEDLNDPYELTDQDLVDYDLINERFGADPDEQVEIIDPANIDASTDEAETEKAEEDSGSAIVFGGPSE